jgi:hypothetical protein
VPPPWRGEKQVDAFGDIDHPVMTPSLDVVLQRSAANARNKLSFPKIRSGRIRAVRRIRPSSNAMVAIIYLLGTFIADLLKSRRRLEVENLFLRHQLNNPETTAATSAAAGE